MTTPVVNVVLMDFPNSQRELVVTNEDGTYTILLNSRLSHADQLRGYEHALKHIHDYDFQKDDVQAIEAHAHQITVPDSAERVPADRFKNELTRLRRERKRIQKELEKKEREIAALLELKGPDWLFRVGEERRLRET